MILSAGQPYFAPFPGFFYKIHRSDIFVLLDQVQFPRGTTWVNRNRFKNDQGALWITIPVWKKGLGLQRINEVRIYHEGRWAKKHLASLRNAYSKSPYFVNHAALLENMFSDNYEYLADLNLAIIRYLIKQCHIQTKVLLLSQLVIDESGDRLPIEICKSVGASTFLAQRPAQKFIDPLPFSREGIDLEFFSPPSPVYPQLWGDFIPNLSTFDLLFNCGPKAGEILTGDGPSNLTESG